ncbi:CHAT domain-containing protein [Streptosporangiaceae bacterium NEAU-GS5]|nr:CHAT domain-containing protein [Streptosporangiaceae bacterium NEAU-GS5]
MASQALLQSADDLRAFAGMVFDRLQSDDRDADRDLLAEVLGRLLEVISDDDEDADSLAGLRGQLLLNAGVHTEEVAGLLRRGRDVAEPDSDELRLMLYLRAVCLSDLPGPPTGPILAELLADLEELHGLLSDDDPLRAEVRVHLADAHWHQARLLMSRFVPPGVASFTDFTPQVNARLAAELSSPEGREALAEARHHLEQADRLAPGNPQYRGLLAGVQILTAGTPAAAQETVKTAQATVKTLREAAADLAPHAEGPSAAALREVATASRAAELVMMDDPPIDDLRAIAAELPEGHVIRPQVLARLGLALHARGDMAAAIEPLAAALPGLGGLEPLRERTAKTLANGVMALAGREPSQAELTALLGDLTRAWPDGPDDAESHAAFGSVLVSRGVRAISRADFETGTRHLNRAIDLLSDDDSRRHTLRFVIAGALADRYSVDKDLRYLDDALAALSELPPGWNAVGPGLPMLLGLINQLRAFHDPASATRRDDAAAKYEEALEQLPPDSPHRALLRLGIDVARVTDDPVSQMSIMARMRALTAGADPDMVTGSEAVLRLLSQSPLNADPAAMRQAAHDLAAQRPGRFPAALVEELISLAHLTRGQYGAAVEAKLAALTERSADVLLQTGVDRALDMSREAADDALEAARLALDHGYMAEALQALELARGMTLHAATAGLPQSSVESGPVGVPGDERTEAVVADPELSRPPSVADIAVCLRERGWDALAYLLPDRAVIVRPDGTVEPFPLPGLADRRALAAFTGAAPESAEWGAALREVCAWAWRAAMEPLLVRLGLSGRIVRLVVVPWGELGLVPWQAAGAPGEGRLCERAAVSFAASARQLLRTVIPVSSYGTAPVVVADPKRDIQLRWGRNECAEIVRLIYPAARRFGTWPGSSRPQHEPAPEPATEPDPDSAPEPGPEPAPEPATVDALTDLLPGGPHPASMLHFACHAQSNAVATRSGLELTEPLTVARLLDRLPDDGPGALVVLSACTSDFTENDFDEALTLATALLATGASTVIGSRWRVGDDARTALMMLMFHHQLAVHDPAEALRRAQAWMLAPRPDELPPDISPIVRTGLDHDLGDPAVWGAFTHQGR